ncbi:MAG TPA: winged helix-turn-helix transcriptional regulator [Anaerolineae bacterium]|nr:winged helix-turn-helix transcriptional regulator [Anaerolineae bacterium]
MMNSNLEEEVCELHSRLCEGLADPRRILILYALADHARNVTDLSEELNIPQPTVSRHLKNLRERGIVNSRREAQSIYYTIADPRIIEALDLLRQVLADMLESQASLARSVTEITHSQD